MDFPFGQTVFRDRRTQVTDPYNPARTTSGDWDPAQTITLPGGFVAATSSSALANATRDQILTSKSLFLTNPDADVVAGDRIRTADMTFSGDKGYFVKVRPAADTNPFTGWRPVVEIPLELTEG